MPWDPKTILRADRVLRTATDTVQVKTDAGVGYLKALGNHGGPHLLAADFIGTQLANWLGLPTFELAIIQVTDLDDEIQFLRGGKAQPGPAFVTRQQAGWTRGGAAAELNSLVNPADLGKLILFDTWTRNCDRHPPDLTTRKPNRGNVFLSTEGVDAGKMRLIAMDHTHCFHCGRNLDAQLSHIDLVKDDRIYGLFPEFQSFLRPHWETLQAAAAKLQTLDQAWVKDLIGAIPAQWQVDAAGRAALATQVCNRADYMNETFIASLKPIWYDTKDTIMNATKGYYCLVQYCPDIARAEAANVGVVLFAPEHKFIRAMVSDNNRRIQKFFGRETDNYQNLTAMKNALVQRIEVEKAEFGLLTDLQLFVETRANKVILTNPKPVKVFNPEDDLNALFQELVEHPISDLTLRAESPLRERLSRILQDDALKTLIKRDFEINVPTLREKLSVEYGFQNGRLNLIQPVEFEQHRRGTIINAACKRAVEGNSIYRNPDQKLGDLQLIVVADFTETTSDMATVVGNIFSENNVRMFTPASLDDLKQEILEHGKPVSNS